MRTTFTVLLLGFATILKLNAQEPKDIVELFFQNYQKKDYKTAIQNAVASNPWLKKDTIVLNKWEKRLLQTSSNKGKYCGYEIIETTETGKSFVNYTCLVKHEKAPFIISIVIYKPKDKWQVNGIVAQKNRQQNTRNNLTKPGNRQINNRKRTK